MTDLNKTEIVVILDRSGSMYTTKDDMEGGFASFVAEQRAQPGQCFFSLYQFDDQFETVYEERPASDVPPLVIEPRGNTALLDAVGRAVSRVGQRLAAKQEDDRPGIVIVQVITDGMENSSTEYTYAQVGEMIKLQRETYKWQFVFLGADLSVSAAAQLGFASQAVASVSFNTAGVMRMYNSSSRSISEYRTYAANGGQDAVLSLNQSEIAGVDPLTPTAPSVDLFSTVINTTAADIPDTVTTTGSVPKKRPSARAPRT